MIAESQPAPSAPALEAWLDQHVDAGHWPGAVYAVGRPGPDPEWAGAVGCLAVEPAREPARLDALYDLASLTKPLVTAAVALRLSARGELDLERPLERELPELRGYAGRTPSMSDLMAHRAGLPAWAPIYRLAATSEGALAAIAGLPQAATSREAAVYGCLGIIVAGFALERLTGRRLDQLFVDEVAGPAGVEADEARFGPLPLPLLHRVAPTEVYRQREEEMAAAFSGRSDAPRPLPRRGQPIRGIVHDNNAHFLDNVAGNAGLFATARAVFRIASAMVTPRQLFGEREIRWLSEPIAESGREVRTFGMQSSVSGNSPGSPLGTDAFGHVGFTGTSVWISPSLPLVAVLLTNRVHPAWVDAPMQSWRREFHERAVQLSRGAS
jgi:CubicO group peptidase (beta-lactamase class C family)